MCACVHVFVQDFIVNVQTRLPMVIALTRLACLFLDLIHTCTRTHTHAN